MANCTYIYLRPPLHLFSTFPCPSSSCLFSVQITICLLMTFLLLSFYALATFTKNTLDLLADSTALFGSFDNFIAGI